MPFDPQPTLTGELLELRPLRPEDWEALYEVASDPLIWEQHPERDRHEPHVFHPYFEEQLASGGALLVLDAQTGEAIGMSRFHGYEADAREVEIGWTFLARRYWGGVYNGELKELTLGHAFRFVDTVVFLVAPENVRSRRAVEKIGAVEIGERLNAYGRRTVAYRLDAGAYSAATGRRVTEAELMSTENGLVPKGQGWFVLDARDTHWWQRNGRGVRCEFEGAGFDGATDFMQLGINLTRIYPGEPMSMYHWEADEEDFLVLAGEALLIVEGEERLLRPWDFVHCPPRTKHTIVGAGDGPCLVLAVGGRDRSTGPDWGAYTVDEAALRHGAGVDEETTVPAEAYARFGRSKLTRYQEGWLPDRL